MSGNYRFLPWTREGLITHVAAADTLSGDMPANAEFPVRVQINDSDEAGVDLSLYGPGDIIGVDPRGIVRLDPRRLASDVEPNYMAAIEFDRPDFPWMFTPAKAGASDRLRPWCVLVVVRLQDGVDIAQSRERPLPTLTITGDAKASDELPDLAESWAWAHTQVITEKVSAEAVAANLREQPALNVSRIVCPRRLEPGRRYYACLVPAFAVGVLAGLGRPLIGKQDLAPAWTKDQTEAELPVYYHWEFGTGPGGDFESLARKLEPPSEPLDVGVSPMFIGAADPGLPSLASSDSEAVIAFEGALVGPDHQAPDVLDEIPDSFLGALAALLDAHQAALDGEQESALPVAPPLYGRWHVQQHVVADKPRWFRELNLDPRYRAVAGLAAEVVRANQEELMHDSWLQVGDVLGANRLLNLARFGREAAMRLHRRALATLDIDRLLLITAPLHTRVLLQGKTVRSTVHNSIVPDAVRDPSFRRITAARSPLLRRAERMASTPAPTSGAKIIRSINDGTLVADPTRILPDALTSAAAISSLKLPRKGPVDLTPIGGTRAVDVSLLRSVASKTTKLGKPPSPSGVVVRPDLARTGIVVRAHLEALVEASAINDALFTSTAFQEIVDVASESPEAAGFLLPAKGDKVAAIDVDRSGTVTVRSRSGVAAREIGHIRPQDAQRGSGLIDIVLAARRVAPLPPGGLPTVPPPTVPPIRVPPVVPPPATTPRLVKRPDAIRRLQRAFKTHVGSLRSAETEPENPPALALETVGVELLTKTDPAPIIHRRIASLLRVNGQPLAAGETRVVHESSDLHPLHATPQLRGPMYEPLAAYAGERLLPGVDRIEANTVGLLKTNPRFVEAFLIGANVELASEYLWREYPARPGITPLRHFWARDDGREDIPPIADFAAGVKLGTSARGGPGGQMVLIVRGDLLRRYPTTVVYAVKAGPDRKMSKTAADHVEPNMRGFMDPDIAFVGFDLSRDEVLAAPGYFFVLQQQATEPRFGFDIPEIDDGTVPSAWREATWDHVAVGPGRHLKIKDNPMSGIRRDQATFVNNAAHLAAITLQQPVRVAIHAQDLIPAGGT